MNKKMKSAAQRVHIQKKVVLREIKKLERVANTQLLNELCEKMDCDACPIKSECDLLYLLDDYL